MDDETQTSGTTDAPVTDTATTQSSEADVQTNTDAPEAAEVKETTVNATDTAEDKLYAGKYKTVEDMEKGYAELQSKYGQTTSDKAELTRILNEAFATPDTSDTGVEDLTEATPQDDPIKRDLAVMKFMMSHPEVDGEAVKDILKNDPMVKDIQSHEAKLEYAFLRSQSIAQPKAIAEATKTAQAEAHAKVAEKQSAQVETATKSAEKTDEISELREKATGNYTQEERDAARRALIRKQLVDL